MTKNLTEVRCKVGGVEQQIVESPLTDFIGKGEGR